MLHLPMPFFRLIRSFHNFLTSIPPGYPFAFSGEWFLRRKKYSIRFYATLQRFIIYQTFSPCQSFFAENLSISVFLSTIHRKGCWKPRHFVIELNRLSRNSRWKKFGVFRYPPAPFSSQYTTAVKHRGAVKIMNSFLEIWKSVQDYCKTQITEVAFNVWIAPLTLVRLAVSYTHLTLPTIA